MSEYIAVVIGCAYAVLILIFFRLGSIEDELIRIRTLMGKKNGGEE